MCVCVGVIGWSNQCRSLSLSRRWDYRDSTPSVSRWQSRTNPHYKLQVLLHYSSVQQFVTWKDSSKWGWNMIRTATNMDSYTAVRGSHNNVHRGLCRQDKHNNLYPNKECRWEEPNDWPMTSYQSTDRRQCRSIVPNILIIDTGEDRGYTIHNTHQPERGTQIKIQTTRSIHNTTVLRNTGRYY